MDKFTPIFRWAWFISFIGIVVAWLFLTQDIISLDIFSLPLILSFYLLSKKAFFSSFGLIIGVVSWIVLYLTIRIDNLGAGFGLMIYLIVFVFLGLLLGVIIDVIIQGIIRRRSSKTD